MGEQRLRLEAMLLHCAASGHAAYCTDSKLQSAQQQEQQQQQQQHQAQLQQQQEHARSEPVLQAFLAAVHDILLKQSAAVQHLQQWQSYRRSGTGAGAQPMLTLLQLSVQMEGMEQQLRQLCDVCRCLPVQRGTDTSAPLQTAQPNQQPTTAQQLQQPTSNSAAQQSQEDSTDGSMAVSWPGTASVWAQRWGWAPSKWQLEGVLQGCELLDHLHHSE